MKIVEIESLPKCKNPQLSYYYGKYKFLKKLSWSGVLENLKFQRLFLEIKIFFEFINFSELSS